MSRTTITVAGILLAALTLNACGGDRTERGLAPAEEAAVPESERELEMTEAERQAQLAAEDENAETE